MAIIGFVGQSINQRAIENIALKKVAPSKESLGRKAYASAYLKTLKKQQKAEAEYKLGLRKRPSDLSRGQFKKSLSSIGKSLQRPIIPSRNAPMDSQRQYPDQSQETDTNFIQHRDEREVYGDEGLTFFDSNKSRSQGRTGGLFGF